MPQPLMLKKMKLNGSMKTNKTSRTNTKKIKIKKGCPFPFGGLECKSRKWRDTRNNRHVWSSSAKWSRSKANKILSKEHTGHNKHPLPTALEMSLHMYITRWSIPKSDWLCSLQPKIEKLCTVNKHKIWSWLWLRSQPPYCKIQV